MQRVFILLLAVLLVLSGCTDTNGPTAETPVPTTDVAPTIETTTTASSSRLSDELAPGITDEGIEDVMALFAAHQRELTARGFVSESRTQRMVEGVQFTTVASTVTVSPGGDRALSHFVENRDNQSQVIVDIWSNTTHDTTRRNEDGNVTYTVGPRFITDDTIVWSGNAAHYIIYPNAEAFEVEAVETRDGVQFVILAVEDSRDTEAGNNSSRMTLVVDELGRIHQFTLQTQYGDLTSTYSYQIVQIGDTDPKPPVWLNDVPA